MTSDVRQRAMALRLWRQDVHSCRRCRGETPPDGLAFSRIVPGSLVVHYEDKPRKPGMRCGWATPMLDKSPLPDPGLERLERSLSSRLVLVMEAPNQPQ
jgi:hypothetical protein